MNILTLHLARRFHWLQLPGLLLITLLQRTPVLRVLVGAESACVGSPFGQVLRSSLAVAATLGTVDTLAGATTMSTNPASPASATVGTAFTGAFAITGAPVPTQSYTITGLPPGLNVTNGTAISGGFRLNASNGTITGTPTTAGAYDVDITAYEFTNATGRNRTFIYTINVTGAAATAPSITTAPSPAVVNVGGSVTFNVSATGTAPLTYQWFKDNTAIDGATQASYTINPALTAHAGSYHAVVSNSAGSATSSTATLTVNDTGSDATALLYNLSARAFVGTGDNVLIAGFVVNSTSGKNVLLRAVGPKLTDYGVTGALADPKLTVFNAQGASVGSNDNWDSSVAATFTAVGAGGFNAGSKDAALVQTLSNGGTTTHVTGNGDTTGVALAEAFDTAPSASSRLSNISARARVGTGDDVLIAGFIVGGSGNLRVLVRAVGPKLTAHGLNSAILLGDPTLEIFNAAGVKLYENDNWDASLASTFTATGAFGLDAGSKDAALVVTLPAGAYTAIVRGANGTSGIALVEVYEVR